MRNQQELKLDIDGRISARTATFFNLRPYCRLFPTFITMVSGVIVEMRNEVTCMVLQLILHIDVFEMVSFVIASETSRFVSLLLLH